MQETLTLSIAGMHCGGCVQRVSAALKGVKGVELEAVEVGSARVTVDSTQASVEGLLAAMKRIGFSAEVKKS